MGLTYFTYEFISNKSQEITNIRLSLRTTEQKDTKRSERTPRDEPYWVNKRTAGETGDGWNGARALPQKGLWGAEASHSRLGRCDCGAPNVRTVFLLSESHMGMLQGGTGWARARQKARARSHGHRPADSRP